MVGSVLCPVWAACTCSLLPPADGHAIAPRRNPICDAARRFWNIAKITPFTRKISARKFLILSSCFQVECRFLLLLHRSALQLYPVMLTSVSEHNRIAWKVSRSVSAQLVPFRSDFPSVRTNSRGSGRDEAHQAFPPDICLSRRCVSPAVFAWRPLKRSNTSTCRNVLYERVLTHVWRKRQKIITSARPCGWFLIFTRLIYQLLLTVKIH